APAQFAKDLVIRDLWELGLPDRVLPFPGGGLVGALSNRNSVRGGKPFRRVLGRGAGRSIRCSRGRKALKGGHVGLLDDLSAGVGGRRERAAGRATRRRL